ncbi:MAG: GAF domain-containing protein [Chloroflexota bacterium]|nr:GAF domain-containing protein [Chloroflexota bacterium]
MEKDTTTKKLLTVQEACQYLGISRTTLLKTEDEGLITSLRTVGGHRRYLRQTLDQYIKATTGLKSTAAGVIHKTDRQVVLPRVVERLAWSSKPADDIMREALEDLVQLLQADAGLVALIDKQHVLRPQVMIGLSLPRTLQSAPIPLDSTISGKVLKFQQPLVYDASEESIPFEGLTQGVCAPLMYRGAPLGVVHILSLSRHQFLPTEVQFLSLVSLYLASLLVNAQVLADSRRREEQLTCLNRLSQTMQEQQNPDRMAEVLLNEMIQITRADMGVVFMYDSTGEIRVAAARGLSTDLDIRPTNQLRAIVAQSLASQEPYLLLSSIPPSLVHLLPIPNKTGGCLLFPLRSQGERLGVLLLCTRSPDASQRQIAFLTLVCAQAALVVQRATLYHRLVQMGENERRLRRYYEKMIEAAPVAMEIIDRNCKIIGWNEAAEQLSGISREEAIGADKFRLQPGLIKYNGPEILADVFENKQISKISDFPYERTDGVVRHTDLTFLPYVDNHGEVSAIIMFAQDVTELKMLRQSVTDAKATNGTP